MSAPVVLAPSETVAQAGAAPGRTQPGRPSNADAAQQFEGMLMSYMFQQMRQTVQPSGLFGNDTLAQSTYEFLLDQAVSTRAVDAGKGWGLSQRLEAAWDARSTRTQSPER